MEALRETERPAYNNSHLTHLRRAQQSRMLEAQIAAAHVSDHHLIRSRDLV
jgi:hypothetical protein